MVGMSGYMHEFNGFMYKKGDIDSQYIRDGSNTTVTNTQIMSQIPGQKWLTIHHHSTAKVANPTS